MGSAGGPGFPMPDSIESAQICRKSGKLAVSGLCSADPRGNAVYTEYFAKGTVPTDVCNNHVAATVCEESGLLPTEFCPSKVSRVFMAIPAGESGETDDTVFGIPGAVCPIHSQASTIIGPEIPSSSDIGSNENYGPGYIPYNPSVPSPTLPNYTVPNVGPFMDTPQ